MAEQSAQQRRSEQATAKLVTDLSRFAAADVERYAQFWRLREGRANTPGQMPGFRETHMSACMALIGE